MLRMSLALVLFFTASVTASAKTIVEAYDVSSYSMNHHSLYMNGLNYHFQSGAQFVRYSDGTGSLTGTATNAENNGYKVSLSFAGFRNWTQQKAANLGAKGAGLGDVTTWTFMDLVDVSTLTGVGAFAGTVYELLMKPLDGPYTFQYGIGANDKQRGVLGLSGWFYTKGDRDNGTGFPCKKNYSNNGGSVCDFNLKLSPVPVPASMAMFPVGLGMLVALRRRKSRKAA